MMSRTILPVALLLLACTFTAAEGHDPIPCEESHDAHSAAVAMLATAECATVTECPEGSQCAEAVEALANYYADCGAEEDAEFVALEGQDPVNPCMAHAGEGHDDHDDEDGHDDHAHGDNPTIPCEGATGHEEMHDEQVAKLADGACLGKTTCPEGSPCAEAIEVLAEYYERCEVGHSDEDPEFVAVETEDPESPCMEHAHEDHDDHDDHGDEDGHDDHAHGDNPTIPCEGATGHEEMHDEQVAKLADDACLGKTTCPEGSPCAEAIEVLVEYYERCNVGHSDEDPEFVAVEIEVPESPCMEHAHDHDDHAAAAPSSAETAKFTFVLVAALACLLFNM